MREKSEFLLAKPPDLKLHPLEADIWYCQVDLSKSVLSDLYALLSHGEKERADQYCFERDRNRYVARHGGLRTVLALYTGVSPSGIKFHQGSMGKPALTSSSISFNMSQSKDLAVFAIGKEAKLGVDIEWIGSIAEEEMDDVARQFFSEGEIAELKALPPDKRTEAFFRCWTRKEAYVKVRGEGLLAPLNSFQVSVTSGYAAKSRRIEGGVLDASEWTLLDLNSPRGYVGALAIDGPGWHIKHERWVIR
jgi:4'-phosphopantetheinyl transferase